VPGWQSLAMQRAADPLREGVPEVRILPPALHLKGWRQPFGKNSMEGKKICAAKYRQER